MYIVCALLLLGAFGLAACGANPPVTAQEQQNTDILPTPPPMPTPITLPPSPTPVAAPVVAQPLSANDLFTANFGSDDLAKWMVIDATGPVTAPAIWKTIDGQLHQVSDGQEAPGNYPTALVTGDSNWQNYVVNTTAYSTGNEEIGVVARASDKGFYVFRLTPAAANGGSVSIARWDADQGGFTDIASAAGNGYQDRQWYQLSIRVDGDHIQGFINGKPVIEANDATLAQGRAGVYGYAEGNLQFADFSVAALPNAQ